MAVEHKLVRACYHMLHKGVSFDLTRSLRLITLVSTGPAAVQTASI